MLFIKLLIMLLILGTSTSIGILVSKNYSNRVIELKEMKNALNMFITKIKFTYAPIPEIFNEIGDKINGNIGNIFKTSASKMKNISAGEAWNNSLDTVFTNLKKDDKQVLKGLGRLLGKTNLEGQISEIELVNNFLNTQLEQAEQEKQKNEKMYKTLGIIAGLTIVIILI